MSIISASTTTTTALQYTADTTGTLVFKTGATPTTALTLNADQSATFAGTVNFATAGFTNLSYTGTLTGGTGIVNIGTAQIYKDVSGNVGIGTVPSTKLDVQAANNVHLGVRNGELDATAIQLNAYNNSAVANIPMEYKATQFVWNRSGAEAMRIDTSGNVGIGVTPSAWAGLSYDALEIGALGNAIYSGNNDIAFTANAYYASGWKYAAAYPASYYEQNAGAHKWFNAPGGTTGAAITFTQAMALNASGNLGVGTSSPLDRLDVVSGGTTFLNRIRNTTANQAAIEFQNSTTGTTTTSGFFVGIGADAAGYVWQYYNGSLVFGTNGSERMRIDSSGNLGIGTSSPATKLEVFGAAGFGYAFSADQNVPRPQGSISLSGSNIASQATYTSVGNSTTVGQIYNYASIADGYARFFDIVAYGSTGGALGNIRFLTGGATSPERMRIDGSGRVLIGFTAAKPNGPVLQSVTSMGAIGSGSASYSTISAADYNAYDSTPTYANCNMSKYGPTATGNLYSCSGTALAGWSEVVGINGNGLAVGTNSGPLLIGTNGSERMRVDASGYFFVGTTTSSYLGAAAKTNINGGGTAALVLTTSGGASYGCGYIHNTATTGNNEFFAFGTEGTWTARGAINYNRGAGLVAYNTTSDYRAKNILGDVENALNTVNNLKVHNAVMKEATIERPMFVAHELQVEAPYAVTGEKDAEDKDGNPIYQQVDTSALIPLLTKAIQELKAEFDEYKATHP